MRSAKVRCSVTVCSRRWTGKLSGFSWGIVFFFRWFLKLEVGEEFESDKSLYR